MKRIYHSALQSPIECEEEIIQAESNGNIVFRHDITNGIHKHFGKCDVLYSEPSWMQGYDKFILRANKEKSTYNNYLSSISSIIEETKKPIWIILGAHAYNRLPKRERCLPISIHGYMTTVLGWNDSNDYKFCDNYEFIEELSKKYNRVGDFCCGYGNTGEIFKNNGKNFVMSDINGKCVYQVAKRLFGYENTIS